MTWGTIVNSFFALGLIGRVVIIGSLIVAMIMIVRRVYGRPRLLALLGFGAMLAGEIIGIGLGLVGSMMGRPIPQAAMLVSMINNVVSVISQLLPAVGIAVVGWAAVSAHRPGSGARV